MLGFFSGSGASESELSSIRKKCSTRESAVKVCLQANSREACDAFQQDLDLCKGHVVCPELAKEFSHCAYRVVNYSGPSASTPDCTAPLAAMRKSLKKKKVLGPK
mmetsp:Transcript_38398/g.61577  ORF Transcript_38398/g.61577 Transcript_38398/m.61577 type:complete len:105 (+) Transcript_38398:93-407(+)|eukprot:CAMPEP_0198680504 /NCGR_PEP_ID=MMETSP1468-20131203/4992_1 /TAXON_ID=1461545 /ORGANISM="Mantoniella sp, Strain CCMP1436" /LENGTH=104 /DNA_ID=CAMNT_0044420887 /DNA_START=74 /DNA_END=388 /DNA_ORIENTATION=-